MSEPWIDPALSVVLALGIGGPVLGLIGLVRQSPRGWLPARAVLASLPLVAGFCAAAAAQGQPAAVWLPFALLAGMCGLFCVLGSERLAYGAAAFGRVARSTRWQSVCLLVAGPLLAVVWAVRLKEPGDLPASREPDPTEIPNAVRRFEEVIPTPVYTDRGRPVRVYRLIYRNASLAKLEGLQAALLRRLKLEARVIALPGGDHFCDCSGWIFTGGHFWLTEEESTITVILEDNGYGEVKEAQVGDLVVYRDGSGASVHFGIVRAAHPDVPVLVESKWGDYGLFLHPVTAHPYPNGHPHFYRSARASHLLRGIGQSPSFPAASRNGRP
jgi:hypothetical protein